MASGSTIRRYSSRREKLGSFLPDLLRDATGYDRIAGYFNSSILEIAGEALDSMAPGAVARVVCNSELDPLDVLTARAAKQAQYREWCAELPDDISPALKQRLERLHGFLSSGRLQVRVLPNKRFGLIHGKAGVIAHADGRQTAFIGSANESRRAWQMNYEIVWADESQESVDWVSDEFEALWHDPHAVELAETIVQDVDRLARRTVVVSADAWKQEAGAEPASAAIELPVYRQEIGLWAHQKYFIERAFREHKQFGARLVLADQVGLGKTIQLALAAKLMALWGNGRVVAFVPKPLLHQWQDELWTLLRIPTAIWTNRGWEDEQGILHPAAGADGLRRCPRRFGIISSGLLTHSAWARDALSAMDWECVILDEAHRARRSNLGPAKRGQPQAPNNLLAFLNAIAPRTRSMLLATATPVQIDPIEAWDLLNALNTGNQRVLGGTYSRWRTQPVTGLDYVVGRQDPPEDLYEAWEWIRDPFPADSESSDFQTLRRNLKMPDSESSLTPEALGQMRPSDRSRVSRLARSFFQEHNPYIRQIIRRTREYLENTIDDTTGEPYLKPVRVRLHGEAELDAVTLPTFLRDAYEAAEAFCEEVGKRPNMNSGFLKTILLRRLGSTLIAGRRTAEKMLGGQDESDEDEEDDERPVSSLYPLSDIEAEKLRRVLYLLDVGGGEDPKYQRIEDILLQGVDRSGPWLDYGCIIFSQYYDSVYWVAEKLSARLPEETVGVYAGAGRSGIFRAGRFERMDREVIKSQVRSGEMRLVIGTDAASEGLNLQKLGTLINLDLPWNPTRLEQRKGRIQRIGQVRDEVLIYNLRYRGSVEDRVHQLLSGRLEAISNLFGQLPDVLEDVWIAVAENNDELALQTIGEVPEQHPFELKYDRITSIDWESCAVVLDEHAQLEPLMRGW